MNVDLNASTICRVIKKAIKEIHHQSRDIDVVVTHISFEDGLSKKYFDDGELVADYINRANINVQIKLDYKKGKDNG